MRSIATASSLLTVNFSERSEHLFVVVLLVSIFVLFVPVAKLLGCTGHNPFWCLFVIFPGLNLLAFWFFAFKPWPADKRLTTDA
jgi:hypothetical protein